MRREKNIPAQLAIQKYFSNTNRRKYRGKTPSNIADVTNHNIKQRFTGECPTEHQYCQINLLQLENLADIENIRAYANDRDLWRYHINYFHS